LDRTIRTFAVNAKLKCPLFSQIEMSPFWLFDFSKFWQAPARQAEGEESGSSG
jgi:hypothetical protein